MPVFKNAEEMVAWVLHEYQPAPIAMGDPLLEKLLRLEREGMLRFGEGFVLLALTKRESDTEARDEETVAA